MPIVYTVPLDDFTCPYCGSDITSEARAVLAVRNQLFTLSLTCLHCTRVSRWAIAWALIPSGASLEKEK